MKKRLSKTGAGHQEAESDQGGGHVPRSLLSSQPESLNILDEDPGNEVGQLDGAAQGRGPLDHTRRARGPGVAVMGGEARDYEAALDGSLSGHGEDEVERRDNPAARQVHGEEADMVSRHSEDDEDPNEAKLVRGPKMLGITHLMPYTRPQSQSSCCLQRGGLLSLCAVLLFPSYFLNPARH